MGTKSRWLWAGGAVAALALALTLWLEPGDLEAGMHGPDGRNYLSLLRSLLFDRDLLSSLPLLVLPLAALLSVVRWRGVVYAALVAGIVRGLGLMLAGMGRLVDPGQYIPPAWQLRTLGQVVANLPSLVRQHLLTPHLAAAPVVALPATLGLVGLAWVTGRLRNQALKGLAAAAVALPLVAALLLPLTDGRSKQDIERLESAGALDGYPRSTCDLYDLSEGYLKRGAYSFGRGQTERAVMDLHTARDIDAARTWVRFHQAEQRHVPNPVDWPVGKALRLVGWERAGSDAILYWRPQTPVLDPPYRTELGILDAEGNAVNAAGDSQAAHWRSLGNEIVRAAYPLKGAAGSAGAHLEIIVFPAGGASALGRLELRIDGES